MKYAHSIRACGVRVVAIVVALVSIQPAEVLAASKNAPRPNILFIMADDHASHAISAYGSKINKTPNIDRLALEGMLFKRCYVTNAICGPSRATILTGVYPHRTGYGLNAGVTLNEWKFLPKLLQDAGYDTAVVGKWHLSFTPDGKGFNYYAIIPQQGEYYRPKLVHNGTVVEHPGYVTDVITNEALRWLRELRDPQKPFMLFYHHKAPHRPWRPALRHLRNYADVTIPEPETLFDNGEGRGWGWASPRMRIERDMNANDLKMNAPMFLVGNQETQWRRAYDAENEQATSLSGKQLVSWKYQRFIKDYLRCVDGIDENLERVLKYLDDEGLADNTIVVYTSDQGLFLGDHGFFDKRWIYQEALQVPFIVRWPAVVPAGTESDLMVSNVDFAPTLLAAAGVGVPSEMQGENLMPILRGGQVKKWRNSFYYKYFGETQYNVPHHLGVVTDTHKLMYLYRVGSWELFDLVKDPNELNNVYEDPAYSDIVVKLKAEIKRLKKELKDDDPFSVVE